MILFLSSLTSLGASPDSWPWQAAHMLMDPKLTSQLGPFPKVQACTSNCLLNIFTWMSNKHLKFHTSQLKSHSPVLSLPNLLLQPSPSSQFRQLIILPDQKPGGVLESSLSLTPCHIYQQACYLFFKTFPQLTTSHHLLSCLPGCPPSPHPLSPEWLQQPPNCSSCCLHFP